MSTDGAPPGGTIGTGRWWTGSEVLLRATRIWHAYDPCRNRWRSLSTVDRPTFAETYAADFDGKRLVIHQVFPDVENHVSFAYYDIESDAWVTPATEGMHTSAERAKAVTGDELVLWGGRDPVQGEGALAVTWTSSNAGSVFDFSRGTWRPTSIDDAPPARVVTPTMFDFEAGRLAVWGGRVAKHVVSSEASMQEYDACNPETGECPLLSSGGIYDVATDSWQTMNETGAPPPRNTPIVEWYEGKVLVLLGQSYPDNTSWVTFNDGGLYDPATGTWTLFDGPEELDRPAIDGWPHAWAAGGLWISDGDSGLWVLDPDALTFRQVGAAADGVTCSPFTASSPVCRHADGRSFLGFFDAGAWSFSLLELPPYLAEWNAPFELWTGSTLIRWGGERPDPAWVPPECSPDLPTCDIGGPPMLPNATGGLFVP